MDQKYDVIVVGGGLAGLTSAAYLGRAGQRTLLLEQSSRTGGLVSTFWHDGFAFDAGIRAFENSGIIFPMLRSLGIEIPTVRNAVSIGIGDQWTRLDSRDSLPDYARMLVGIFPENRPDIDRITAEIRKVMKYMDVLYGIDNPLFLDDLRDPRLLKILLPWLVRYQLNIGKASRLSLPVNDHLKRFTENQALIDMITQHFFQDTPTFFALSYFGLYLDYSYPAGGMGVLAEKLTEAAQADGVEIRTDTRVEAVDAAAHSIRTAAGEVFHYRKLVWAADQKTLYSSLDAIETPEIIEQSRLADQGEGGDSILSLYIGTDLEPGYFSRRCGAHAFYTPVTEGLSAVGRWQDRADQGPDALQAWTGDYLARTTYEISCPSLRDPALAPDGQTGIIVSTLMDYRLVRRLAEAGRYDAFKQFCIDTSLATLDASLFPGIRDHLLFVLAGTPLTIERETGNAQGAITGWSFTSPEMPAEARFKKIANSIRTPIPDVLQCGQWTFSPSGLPVSILTGKLAADEVIRSRQGSGR